MTLRDIEKICAPHLRAQRSFGQSMTGPVTRQRTSNTERDGASPESDNPSDCCDFGYILRKSGAAPRKSGVGEPFRNLKTERDGQFDPVEHWGKA